MRGVSSYISKSALYTDHTISEIFGLANLDVASQKSIEQMHICVSQDR